MTEQKMRNLTEGSPVKLLISFTLPLLLGMIFQQFYGMIDNIVVGKFLGVQALAGVGSTSSINFLVLGFCNGICAGFVIPVALRFGQKDFPALRRVVGNILWLSLFFAVGITLTVCLLCRRILVWMHTPADAFSYAYTYIFIIFLGIPSLILYNTLSGIIRSLGNSRVPLYFLIFSSLLNIALDLLLVIVIPLGVAGAAFATLISQVLSGLLCLVYMIKNYPILHLSREDLRLRSAECRQLLTMGLPMGLQYTVTAIGCTMIQAAVNNLGSTAMAAVTAASRVQALLITPCEAIGIAAATYAGQNVGAGRLDRVRQGTRVSFMIGFLYSAAAFAIVMLWSRELLCLFLDPAAVETAQILDYGHRFLLVNASFYLALLLIYLFRTIIQGMGYSPVAILSGVLELAARAVLSLVIVPAFGYTAVCFTNPAAWMMADLFLVPMYFIALHRLSRKLPNS